MKKLFGTDGIRGKANEHPMTVEMSARLGAAIALVLGKRKGRNAAPKVLIGKDTRISGYMFEESLGAGLCSMGAEVMFVGPMPTPGVAFLTHNMRMDVGVVISASHNPFYDNGIKLFDRFGFKLPDEVEAEIEAAMASREIEKHLPPPDAIGKAFRIEDAQGRYIVHNKSTFPKDLTLEGVRIAIDCANGAAYKIAPTVFTELGADIFPSGVEPDGRNINHNCGALHPDRVAKAVVNRRADIGFALDGDADRVIVIDEKGNIVDGDHILAICAQAMVEENKLAKKSVVATVMSNMGLEIALDKMGVKLLRTKVGDRYVVEEMKKSGINLGGEQSGHIIFLDHATTGDGIIAALQVLAVMLRDQKPLSELARIMSTFPQILVNIQVAKRIPIEELKGTSKVIKNIEKKLGKKGRVLVRYSGTEPLARIMVEGENEKVIEASAKEIEDILRKETST